MIPLGRTLLSLSCVLGLAVVLAAVSPAGAACSQPVTVEGDATLKDCLFIAKAALGTESCEPCVCDVNGSGEVRITDALVCLRHVLGGEVPLDCPPCLGSTTTTLPSCASCNDALFGQAAPEELCEEAAPFYDEMLDCPCRECGDVCGLAECDIATPASTAASQGWQCLRCLYEGCRQSVVDCVEN